MTAKTSAHAVSCRLPGGQLQWVDPLPGRHGSPVEDLESFQTAVVGATAMDPDVLKTSPSFDAAAAAGVGHSCMAFAIACRAELTRNLGYSVIPMGNDTSVSVPLAIDAGLGEMDWSGMLAGSEASPIVPSCNAFTDMRPASDQRRCFGLDADCRVLPAAWGCYVVGAIYGGSEPSYSAVCPFNSRRIKRWAVVHDKCCSFWIESGQDCSTCIVTCPITRRGARKRGGSGGATSGS